MPDPGADDRTKRRWTSVPWTRIWAEAPIIIVSILLAFAIDAWWQRLREQSEMRRYLQALQTEFQHSRAQLDSVSTKNRLSIGATLVLVDLTVSQARALSSDSARVLFVRMMDSATFDPSLGVLAAVQSAGVLSNVGNLELRTALGAWSGIVEDSREDAYPVFETALSTVDRWASIGLGIPMLYLAEGLEQKVDARQFIVTLAADDEARHHLASRAAFNRVYQTELDGLGGRIDRVIALLADALSS